MSNFSNSSIDSVFIKLTAVSNSITIEMNETDFLSEILPFEETIHLTNYNIELSDVSYGSKITLSAELYKNNINFYSQEISFEIAPNSSNYPVSPNNFGYWAYDDTDEGYINKPTFNWIELDPNFGGLSGTHYQLDDDDHVDIELPFTFKYHGNDYNQITINSNGWASFCTM